MERQQGREGLDPVLVIGGTGKTGRRVTERLQARGRSVRVGSRSSSPPFDWADRSTWPDVLQGAGAAYITYHPDIAIPGAVDAVASFVETALAAGTRRLVLLSGRGEEEAQRAEDVLRESRADWTIVRSSWFNQNFSESFLLDMVLGGEVALPAGNVGEPFIDADDIADVAVAALTEPGHEGQLYEVTGSRLLTFAEAVGEIASATGRDIRYRQLSRDAFAAALRAERSPTTTHGSSTTCSPLCWTVATSTSPTACDVHWAESPATSVTTSGTRPQSASGRPERSASPDAASPHRSHMNPNSKQGEPR